MKSLDADLREFSKDKTTEKSNRQPIDLNELRWFLRQLTKIAGEVDMLPLSIRRPWRLGCMTLEALVWELFCNG